MKGGIRQKTTEAIVITATTTTTSEYEPMSIGTTPGQN
jgi:hypothetical protein